MNDSTRLNFSTIDQLIAHVKRSGSHFFDKDTMRFFRSRVSEEILGGRIFITSERFVTYYPRHRDGPRMYTVRYVDDSGSIEEISEFQEYASLSGAKARARREAKARGWE